MREDGKRITAQLSRMITGTTRRFWILKPRRRTSSGWKNYGKSWKKQASNNSERVTQVQQEIDFLTEEITSGVGLGGRDRRAASATERARVNVTRAIKAALQRLSVHHPALGLYLTRTINTGTFCSYTPDMQLPSPWKL